MQLIVLRHGATAWNETARLQGRADPPLSVAGLQQLQRWNVPKAWRTLPCWVSPLRRARETAQALGWRDARVEAALIEMDWGTYEGRSLADLRLEQGAALAQNEARGLDFRPTGGESPREVMRRLQRWLSALPNAGQGAVLITHKGVRRALLALATGWDMRGAPPLKLRDHEALRLHHETPGRVAVIDKQSLVPSS